MDSEKLRLIRADLDGLHRVNITRPTRQAFVLGSHCRDLLSELEIRDRDLLPRVRALEEAADSHKAQVLELRAVLDAKSDHTAEEVGYAAALARADEAEAEQARWGALSDKAHTALGKKTDECRMVIEERDRAQAVSARLWQLLDDIDTMDDAAKSDEKAYREGVRRLHRLRFQYADSPDGHALVWKDDAPTGAAGNPVAVILEETMARIVAIRTEDPPCPRCGSLQKYDPYGTAVSCGGCGKPITPDDGS